MPLSARFWLWFWVDVRHPGRVPVIGPVLLCINHPNNLIDSLVVGAARPRKVHYLAAATLVRNRLIARFLRACGAIRVYRKKDDPNRMDSNGGALAFTRERAVHFLVAEREAIIAELERAKSDYLERTH